MPPSEYQSVSLHDEATAHLGDNYVQTDQSIYLQVIVNTCSAGGHGADAVRTTSLASATRNSNTLASPDRVLHQPREVPNLPALSGRCRCRRTNISQSRSLFWGIVVLRYQSCKQCSRAVTEATIRLPDWLTQFNLYYLGSPERILRLQRKVSWESEDNILRHCNTGNLDGVKDLLFNGRASLYDIEPNYGRTALHCAIQKNNLEICAFLLQLGADPAFEDYNGTTVAGSVWERVLTRSHSDDQLDHLRRLLPGNLENDDSFTHLHFIVTGQRPISLREALNSVQHKSQLNTPDSGGRTPLHWASQRGDLPTVTQLLNAGAAINVIDNIGSTPLMLASAVGNTAIMQILFSHSANVDLTHKQRQGPLHFASRNQSSTIPIQLLLEAGAGIDDKNRAQNTPLSGAAMQNHIDIGRYLIRSGADVETQGIYGDTPLFEAIYHHSHGFLRMLLEEGANVRHVNGRGETILHAVGFEGDVETVKVLKRFHGGLPGREVLSKNGESAWGILARRTSVPEGFGEAFRDLLEKAMG